VSRVLRRCLRPSNKWIRQVSEGGGNFFTWERHGYGFVGGGAVFLHFSGRCSLVTFFWGKTRSARRALQKYEKQVRGRKVVVRDGGGGHGRPVARLRAPQDPVVAANSLGNCLHCHKTTRCQGIRGGVLGGQAVRTGKLATRERRSCTMEQMVMVW
jgi:hypothetical protein